MHFEIGGRGPPGSSADAYDYACKGKHCNAHLLLQQSCTCMWRELLK